MNIRKFKLHTQPSRWIDFAAYKPLANVEEQADAIIMMLYSCVPSGVEEAFLRKVVANRKVYDAHCQRIMAEHTEEEHPWEFISTYDLSGHGWEYRIVDGHLERRRVGG